MYSLPNKDVQRGECQNKIGCLWIRREREVPNFGLHKRMTPNTKRFPYTSTILHHINA